MMQSKLWLRLQHAANPLHVYCRLLDLGLEVRLARWIGRLYEKYGYAFLMRSMKS